MPWASRAFGTNRSGPCVSCPRPAVLNGWCFGDREGCAGLATRADLGPSLAQRLPGFSLMETRIAEPQRRGVARWHGDKDARRAVYNNRTRLRSEVGKQAMRNRAELVERSFAHILDRGGMRRTWLRGRENVHKRYLIHVAGHNLGLLMRLLIGAGTPKEAVASGWCF